jgi:peptidoglycan/LPS O-acetylase OafA/YrhL
LLPERRKMLYPLHMSKPSSYRPAIDLARFIACFGIVAAHAFAMEDDWVGHLALALFLVLTAFLAMQSAQRAGGKYPFIARAKRLVLPWLAWSFFYRLVDLRINDDPSKYQLLNDPWTLLIGTSVHLWFLPFVMLAMVMVEPVSRAVTTPNRLALALLALVAGSTLAFWLVTYYTPVAPLVQWLFSLPLYILGLLIAIAHPMRRAIWPGLAAAGMTIIVYAVTFAVNGIAVAWWWVIPLSWALFEGFWRMPVRGPFMQKLLPELGKAAFGIYLLHPFFMLVCYKLYGAGVDRLFATLLTFTMSWVAVLLMRRIPIFVRIT